MANSHINADANLFMSKLRARAKEAVAEGTSTIAGGAPVEDVLAHWKSDGVDVAQLPEDEQGILRISIGGGETPVPLNYCRFRGEHGACVDLLRKALAALEAGPTN